MGAVKEFLMNVASEMGIDDEMMDDPDVQEEADARVSICESCKGPEHCGQRWMTRGCRYLDQATDMQRRWSPYAPSMHVCLLACAADMGRDGEIGRADVQAEAKLRRSQAASGCSDGNRWIVWVQDTLEIVGMGCTKIAAWANAQDLRDFGGGDGLARAEQYDYRQAVHEAADWDD